MDERANQVSEEEYMDDELASGDARIQETREEIGETLEAIQAKLAPERLTGDARDAAMEAVDHAMRRVQEAFPELSQQAQDAATQAVHHAVEEAKAAARELGEQARAAVRDATIGRVQRMANTTSEQSKYVGSSAIRTIKQNPGPAALTALGVGWLLMSGRSGQTHTQTGYPTAASWNQGSAGMGSQVQSRVGEAMDTAGHFAGQVQGEVSGAANQVQQTASEVAGQVQSGISTAAGQVQQTASQVAGQAQSAMTVAAGQVQDTAGQLTTQVQQVPSRTRRMIEENPLPLGLVALAVGSAAALALPETRKENEIMGEARDAVVESAQVKGQEVAGKVQSVVEGVQTAVNTVEETVEKVKK